MNVFNEQLISCLSFRILLHWRFELYFFFQSQNQTNSSRDTSKAMAVRAPLFPGKTEISDLLLHNQTPSFIISPKQIPIFQNLGGEGRITPPHGISRMGNRIDAPVSALREQEQANTLGICWWICWWQKCGFSLPWVLSSAMENAFN